MANDGDKCGYVYILSNPIMPGIVKIGRSIHGGRIRARDLYKQGGTGVPMPFHMEFEIWSLDCKSHEENIHEELDEYRVNKAREFFQIDKWKAIEAVIRVVCCSYDLTVGHVDLTITGEELVPQYGLETHKLAKELFGEFSLELLLASAIREHLPIDAVKDALISYKRACEERAQKYSGPDSHFVDFWQ